MLDKLKLCACHALTGNEQHYWVLHRYDRTMKNEIIGEAMLPSWLDPQDEACNKATLLRLLNEGDVFDKDLGIKNIDRLQFSFNLPDKYELYYGYEYRNGKWHKDFFDAIEWMWQHEPTEEGIIENGME